jgi:integrase
MGKKRRKPAELCIMARRRSDGVNSYTAMVRVKGAGDKKLTSVKTFKAVSKADEKAARARAEQWAEERKAELQAAVIQKDVRPDLTGLTIAKLGEHYLNDAEIKDQKAYDLSRGLVEYWQANYGAIKVLDFFNSMTLFAARERLITEPTNGRIKDNGRRSRSTVNRYMSKLRAVWRWGRKRNWIPKGQPWPAEGLMYKEPKGRTRFLNAAEIDRVLKAAEVDPLMHAAITVSLSTGLRRGELLRLEWRDIDFDGAKLLVRESKIDEQRQNFLMPAAIDALKSLRKRPVVSTVHVFVMDDGTPLHAMALQARWHKIRKAAGLQDFHWHDFRHTCASIMAQSGAPLLQISGQLGHRNPATTMRYAHLAQGQQLIGHDKLNEMLRRK